jgi:hypothetical protein
MEKREKKKFTQNQNQKSFVLFEVTSAGCKVGKFRLYQPLSTRNTPKNIGCYDRISRYSLHHMHKGKSFAIYFSGNFGRRIEEEEKRKD